MDRDAAKQRLTVMVAATTDPVLGDSDLDALVAFAARPDPTGRGPNDAGWDPTYALGAGAAEGWRWKAGRVTGRVDIQGDDTRLDRSQLFGHCMRMAERYDRQAWATVPLAAPTGARDAVAVEMGWGALLPHPPPPPAAPSPFALPGACARGDNTW